MRTLRLDRALAAAAIPAVLLTSTLARAGDPAAAREQVKIGYQLAQEGKCEEAIPHFVESIKLDVKAVTLINLANCEEKTGKLADALGHWVDARARALAENNAAIQEEAEKRAKALEPRLPKLTVTLAASATGAGGAPPKDVEVERDGVVLGPASMNIPLPVNPGSHTLVVRAKGHEDATTTVTIAEAEAKKVELKLGVTKPEAVASKPGSGDKAAGEAPRTSPLVYVGFGVAAAGFGVGAVTGIMALGAASDADKACPGGVCTSESAKSDAESGKTMGTISTIGFVVGGLGAALGIYGLVWGSPSSSQGSVAVSVGPTGGVVRGSF